MTTVVKNDNQSKATTEELVEIPMIIDKESITYYKKMGYQVKNYLLGNRKVPCVYVLGTRSFRDEYLRMVDNERKAEDRERRCLVADNNGGYIMCPESNKCSECTKRRSYNFDSYRPLSLEKLANGDLCEDRTYEPAAKTDVASDAVAFATLDLLIEDLSKLNKEYGEIIKMIYYRWSVQEIADKLNIPWSTAKDRIKKVKKLAQELYGEKE